MWRRCAKKILNILTTYLRHRLEKADSVEIWLILQGDKEWCKGKKVALQAKNFYALPAMGNSEIFYFDILQLKEDGEKSKSILTSQS